MNQALQELHHEVRTTRWLLQRAAANPVLADDLDAVQDDVRLVDRAHLERIEQLVAELLAEAERTPTSA